MGIACSFLLSQHPGQRVTLWGRDATHVADLVATRENSRLLPGVKIPASIDLTADIQQAVAGADLLVACEQRLVGSDTTLRFPGAQFGLVLGTRRLAERIGADAARALVLEGGELDATQALALGLASRITDTLALALLRTSGDTGRAVRAASRSDLRDADLAALVRSAAVPGLQQRITQYRASLLAQ